MDSSLDGFLEYGSRQAHRATSEGIRVTLARLLRLIRRGFMMKYLAPVLLLIALPAGAGALDKATESIDSGDFEQARSILEAAVAQPGNEADELILLTRVSTALGDYESGVGYGKAAIEAAPDSSEAHFRYAEALRTKMSNVGKMKAMFTIRTYKRELQKAIELDPENLGAREEEVGFLIFAPGIAGGSTSKARAKLTDLEKLDWRSAKLMELSIEAKEEDAVAAEAVFNSLLERYPEDPDIRTRFGYFLQGQARYREADRLFEALVASEDATRSLGALYQRARTRILGKYELREALEFLESYLVELGDDPGRGLPGPTAVHWRMGNAFEQLQKVAEARKSYERALEIDPDNASAKKSLAKLKKG